PCCGGPPRPVQPPATAGMIDTSAPSGTLVSSPSRNRMSSSATKTLTNLRRLPSSSSRRAPRPGWALSRFLMTSRTSAPSTSTSARPPVSGRRVVGMRTETLMSDLVLDSRKAYGSQPTPRRAPSFRAVAGQRLGDRLLDAGQHVAPGPLVAEALDQRDDPQPRPAEHGRVVDHLADDSHHRHARLGRQLDDAADDLALERLLVEEPLGRDDQV